MLFYFYIRRDYNGNKLDQCQKILEFTLVTKNLIYKKIEGNSRKKQFLQEIDGCRNKTAHKNTPGIKNVTGIT